MKSSGFSLAKEYEEIGIVILIKHHRMLKYMPLSKDEIKKGIKASEVGSLENKILEFLEKAKNTDTPAYSLTDIIKAFEMKPRGDVIETFLSSVAFSSAISELKNKDKIVEITVKKDSTKYYMAKDEGGVKAGIGLGKIGL